MQLIMPGYRVIDIVPGRHPLFSIFYQVPEIPQIPSINFWRRSGGGVSERGSESAQPEMRALVDENGRILVLMSHDTDIADGWGARGGGPGLLLPVHRARVWCGHQRGALGDEPLGETCR